MTFIKSFDIIKQNRLFARILAMKFNFEVSDEFEEGIRRLSGVLGYEIGDGITVKAERADRSGVILKNGVATIFYERKHLVWRQLSVLCEMSGKTSEFEIYDDGHFKTLGVMVCVSRGMVPRVETLKKYLDYLAIMGYNLVMLQTDDLFKIKELPYFGYMRGAYTEEELREFDDYAYGYGIEAIPCIECYSHLKSYLKWPCASGIKDTASVLLAREEKTFEFVETMIKTVSSCFRSRRIHIGMDEAWDMGRGRFLDKHGYVPPLEIFNEYMERLISITDKYGLKPMMWSDMYFRVCSKDNSYYDESIVIPCEVSEKIPKGVELIFWHYGENFGCDDAMLKKHKELNREIIYAGGLWEWTGHFPENNFSYKTTKKSVEACRKNGVHHMMTTSWFIESESDLFSTLLGLSQTAELAFCKDPDEVRLRSRFEASTGASFDAFKIMARYHNKNRTIEEGAPDELFLGKHLFWQDVMEGLYDTYLFEDPMSDFYAQAREDIKKHRHLDRWDYLYEYAEAVFDYLAVKCEVAEGLYPAYQKGDRDTLEVIARKLLPALKEKTRRVHSIHRNIWSMYHKDQGFVDNDLHYGGMIARIETAIILICEYLDGKRDRLGELEEPRLKRPLWAFSTYGMVAIPT